MSPPPDPVYDGYFADPFLARFEGRYVAYGSGDDTAPEDAPPGTPRRRVFEALVSDDLRHWSSVGGVLDPVSADLGDAYWAPEVARFDGAYWMYYSVGAGIARHHLRVARADSALGPFVDQGVDLTPAESFAIDAHPFVDVDGSRYLFFARDVLAGERPGTHLAVVRLETPTSVAGDAVEVLSPDADWQIYERDRAMYGRRLDWHTLEGPTVLRHGGEYHLFFSGGSWEGDGYGVSVATAPHPLGPWRHRVSETADLLSTASTGLIGPGHNSVLVGDLGTDLIAFHAWNPTRTKRQMYVETLGWEPDVHVESRIEGCAPSSSPNPVTPTS